MVETKTIWMGDRVLRRDGHDNSVCLNIGKAAKLIDAAEAGQKARVCVRDDDTIEVSIIDE
jgi:hypothetical protein